MTLYKGLSGLVLDPLQQKSSILNAAILRQKVPECCHYCLGSMNVSQLCLKGEIKFYLDETRVKVSLVLEEMISRLVGG